MLGARFGTDVFFGCRDRVLKRWINNYAVAPRARDNLSPIKRNQHFRTGRVVVLEVRRVIVGAVCGVLVLMLGAILSPVFE